jgi:hypothetical protein
MKMFPLVNLGMQVIYFDKNALELINRECLQVRISFKVVLVLLIEIIGSHKKGCPQEKMLALLLGILDVRKHGCDKRIFIMFATKDARVTI